MPSYCSILVGNQNDHLTKELIVLAGKLSLGIEMAIYEYDESWQEIKQGQKTVGLYGLLVLYKKKLLKF